MKQKFKSYAWCLGVCAAAIGAIVTIGKVFNFQVNEVAITSVVTALLGVLVALGVIEKDSDENEEKIDESITSYEEDLKENTNTSTDSNENEENSN